jgi:hypothetical protein
VVRSAPLPRSFPCPSCGPVLPTWRCVTGRPGDAQPAAQTAARQAAPRQSFEVPQSTAALQPPAGLPGAPAAAAGMPNPMANRAVAALPPAQQQAVVCSSMHACTCVMGSQAQRGWLLLHACDTVTVL